MKKWELTASTDGNMIDYSEIIESETEPDFWTCYNIASAHGCEFFTVEEITVLDYDTTAADHCAGLPVDILSPSECADLFGRPVRNSGARFLVTPCKPPTPVVGGFPMFP